MNVVGNIGELIRSILLGLFILGICYLPTEARELNQDSVLELKKQGRIKSLGYLLSVLNAHYPNFTLLEASLREQQGYYFYNVSIITKQAVARKLVIDAATTKIIQDKVNN